MLPYINDNLCLDTLISINTFSQFPSNTKNIIVEDLNNDGINEVLVGNVGNNAIEIYSFIIASTSFSYQSSLPITGGFGNGIDESIAIGNFNSDLYLDIVLTTSNSIIVYKQISNSLNFALLYQQTIPLGFVAKEHYLKVDNIDNTGLDDFYLISANTFSQSGITIMPFLVTASSIVPQTSQTIFKSSTVGLSGKLIDINIANIKNDADGLKDLMITYSNVPDSVFFLENNSIANTVILNKIPLYLTTTSVNDYTINSSEIADINNDGKLDFVFYGNSSLIGEKIAICIGLNNFFLTPHIDVPINNIHITDFKLKDINHDNIIDFVGIANSISTAGNSLIYISTGNSSSASNYFNTPITLTLLSSNIKTDELEVMDIDNNGINDIIFKPWKLNSGNTYLIPNFSYKVTANATPSVICSPNNTTLSITVSPNTPTNTNYNWVFIPTDTIVSNFDNYTTNLAGEYKVLIDFNMYSGNTCTLKSDTLVLNSNTLSLSLNPQNITTCYGSTITTNAAGANTYTWLTNTGDTLSTDPVFSTQALSNTIYSVVGETINGCKGTATLNLNLFPLNTDIITASKNIACLGDHISLDFPSVLSYTWQNGNAPDTTVSPIAQTVYSFSLTDIYGCNYSKSITIYIDPNCDAKIYTGIILNGNGPNSIFRIDNIENYKNNKVSIFNRWGQELFSTTNYNNTDNYWPTKENQASLIPSTYFYSVNLGDGSEIKKGWIELIKN